MYDNDENNDLNDFFESKEEDIELIKQQPIDWKKLLQSEKENVLNIEIKDLYSALDSLDVNLNKIIFSASKIEDEDEKRQHLKI